MKTIKDTVILFIEDMKKEGYTMHWHDLAYVFPEVNRMTLKTYYNTYMRNQRKQVDIVGEEMGKREKELDSVTLWFLYAIVFTVVIYILIH